MAAAAEEKTEAPAASGSAPGGGGSKLVLALVAVNILVTLGMVAVLFISFQHEKTKPSVEDMVTHEGGHEAGNEHGKAAGDGGHAAPAKDGHKRSIEFGKMVTLEQFTVNLSTPGSVSPKFVRVNVSLEVPSDDVESEINSKMPQVRNAIIDLFNSKRPSDVAMPEGRDFLKEEIKNAMNGFLVNGKVKGVFFTSFNVSS